MSDTAQFATWLKRCRQERGLTQDMLAEQVGCASETIRKLESGRRRPSFQMAARLAQVLQLGPDDQVRWMRAARASAEPEPLPSAQPRSSDDLVEPPVYLTPFIGREHELEDLTALLRRADCRLVTVLGPGGVGKTRLAAEVAREAQAFPDGVAWVALASLATPQAIVPAIGDALAFHFAGPKDAAGQLLRFLRSQRTLIVLDNLEHLLDPSGAALDLIESILAQAPGVTVLATSRERLKLPGEWVVELAGLGLSSSDCASCSCDAALQLFAEHAQRVQRDFRLGPATTPAVAEICRLVGGLPLGIELAAAWLRMLPLEEISRELLGDLNAAHPLSHRLPERHRTLGAVVAHSWQLLDDRERRVLARLSVFQGGFSREAAVAVADADLALLAGLADKSLLRRWSADRYDLHEIIRQYAAERLNDDPIDAATTHDRHAAHYCGWLGLQRARLQGREQSIALAAIGAEIDNVRAAWQWAAAHKQQEALRLAASPLHWFYEYRNWQGEGAAVFDTAVTALQDVPLEHRDTSYRRVLGELLGRAGYLDSRTCSIQPAREALDRSIELLRDTGGGRLLAQALVYRAMLTFPSGDYDRTAVMLGEARTQAPGGDTWTHALCDTWEMQLAFARGDYGRAERLFWAALARYRSMENGRGIMGCIATGSMTLIARGKLTDAHGLLREALMLAVAADDQRGMSLVLHQLGVVALRQQQLDEAIYLLREALAVVRVIGNLWDVTRVLNDLGAALLAGGVAAAAVDTWSESLVIAAAIGLTPEAVHALAGLAEHLQQAEEPRQALALAGRVLADPMARTETRERALRVREAIRARMSAGERAVVDAESHGRPLIEIAAELAKDKLQPLLPACVSPPPMALPFPTNRYRATLVG